MLVFIDDSGDPSFAFEKGSTDFFIICSVIFEDELIAQEVALEIRKLKRELKIPDNIEFKFTKSNRRVRIKFLQRISKYNFRIRALIVDKHKIYSEELKSKKESFYSYFIKMLLKHNKGTIENARIRIDGSGDRIFKRTFLSYLTRELNSPDKKIIKKCRLVDSKSDVLIQMTDMIAGTLNRFYSAKKTDANTYRQIITKRIEDEWKFR